MNNRMSYMLVAVVSVAGAAAFAAPASALELACPDCVGGDASMSAASELLSEIPITVWTDAEVYDHDSVIAVEGTVANIRQGFPITITVISPTNNIVAIDQVEPNADGTYTTTLSTSGNLWKYDGTYTIRVQYGSQEINNKVLIELRGGVTTQISPTVPTTDCTADELSVDGYCIPFSITGGTVTGVRINPGTSIVFGISSMDDGMITVTPAPAVFRNLEFAFVDGEDWDDVSTDGSSITVHFPAGTEEVEIVGEFVIPEFGAIAVLVLAAAIVAIVAASARSRLGMAAVPRY